jgi:hypothetical protein
MAEPTKKELQEVKTGKAKCEAYGGNPLKPVKESTNISK